MCLTVVLLTIRERDRRSLPEPRCCQSAAKEPPQLQEGLRQVERAGGASGLAPSASTGSSCSVRDSVPSRLTAMTASHDCCDHGMRLSMTPASGSPAPDEEGAPPCTMHMPACPNPEGRWRRGTAKLLQG